MTDDDISALSDFMSDIQGMISQLATGAQQCPSARAVTDDEWREAGVDLLYAGDD